MIEEEQLGSRIKELRRSAGLTLTQLARKAGISQGYLSKIENGRNAPPVSTLLMLARALDVTMGELFGESDMRRPLSLVRKGERQFVAKDGTGFGYSYQALAPRFHHKHFEPYILTIPVSPKNTVDFHFQHKGEEMLFVLCGKMRFTYGEKTYVLEQGDCIFFDTSVPHKGFCLEDKEVKCLIAVYTPEP